MVQVRRSWFKLPDDLGSMDIGSIYDRVRKAAAGPGTRVVLITTPPQELFGRNLSLTDAVFSAYNIPPCLPILWSCECDSQAQTLTLRFEPRLSKRDTAGQRKFAEWKTRSRAFKVGMFTLKKYLNEMQGQQV